MRGSKELKGGNNSRATTYNLTHQLLKPVWLADRYERLATFEGHLISKNLMPSEPSQVSKLMKKSVMLSLENKKLFQHTFDSYRVKKVKKIKILKY